MAKNKPIGDNARRGSVKGRSQFYNPKIDRYIKRDADTGRILDVKSDQEKFKGVKKEK